MYEKDQDKKVHDTTKTMFDIVPDLAPYKHNTKCCIKCKANCIFNKNNICYSNGILINYDKKQPAICFSHLKN